MASIITSSPSKALPITNLVFRILSVGFLLVSAIVLGGNSLKISLNSILITASAKTIHAYKFGVVLSAFGILYGFLQLPFSIYQLCTAKHLIGFLHFTVYADKVMSYVLITGAAAVYGLTIDTKKFIDSLDDVFVQSGSSDLNDIRSKYDTFSKRANAGATLLLIGFLCVTISSILSSLYLAKKKFATTTPAVPSTV
ncbi:hypothetical protein Syun_022641 [Stephania yunnanensis]|uniref:CASP-like protein n=1 Tax=Stephania yunnanensis TaxID=152371 RepID=A0AAP0F7C8_9MAGN